MSNFLERLDRPGWASRTLQKAMGRRDRTLEIPNLVDTKSTWGSMDKMFTAVAILQLVEQGRFTASEGQ